MSNDMDYQIKSPMGIDISAWERTINWNVLSPRPLLVIAKASEYKWEDAYLTEHWKNMTIFGAPRGAYHFFRANDVQAQVDKYLAQCRLVGALVNGVWKAEIPPILDAEYAPPATPKKKPKGWVSPPRGTQLAGQYKTWLDLVEKATGVRPIIYTNINYWNYTHDWLGKPPSWTRDYKLWLAYYPDRKDDFPLPTKAMLPAGWLLEDVVMWQYAEDGRLVGIPYDGVDLNWISPAWLESLGVEPPTPVSMSVELDWDEGDQAKSEFYANVTRVEMIFADGGKVVRP